MINADIESSKTDNPKIYAGGDAVTGPNLAIQAIHAGRIAAISINRDLGVSKEGIPVPDNKRIFFEKDRVTDHVSNKLPEKPLEERSLTEEDTMSFDPATAVKEAERCMNCGCYSVNASDMSPVMVMMDAELVTTKKVIPAKDFFTRKLKAYEMLEPGELIKEVRIRPMEGYTTGYDKFRVRDSLDFAIVSLAYAYKLKDGVIDDIRLVLGAVAPVPVIKDDVAKFMIGKKPTKELAKEAGELAVSDAVPLRDNEYKVAEVKALIGNLVERMSLQ